MNSYSRGRSVAWLCLLALLATAAGCVNETTTGDKTVLTFQWWVPISVMVGGMIAAPVGWFLREAISRLSFGLMIIGPLAILAGISLFTDRSEVDSAGYKVRMGIFGSSTSEGRFDELTHISFTTRRGRRSTSHYLVCHKKSGESDEISLGNAISERAAALILRHAQAKGVQIDLPPGI